MPGTRQRQDVRGVFSPINRRRTRWTDGPSTWWIVISPARSCLRSSIALCERERASLISDGHYDGGLFTTGGHARCLPRSSLASRVQWTQSVDQGRHGGREGDLRKSKNTVHHRNARWLQVMTTRCLSTEAAATRHIPGTEVSLITISLPLDFSWVRHGALRQDRVAKPARRDDEVVTIAGRSREEMDSLWGGSYSLGQQP